MEGQEATGNVNEVFYKPAFRMAPECSLVLVGGALCRLARGLLSSQPPKHRCTYIPQELATHKVLLPSRKQVTSCKVSLVTVPIQKKVRP